MTVIRGEVWPSPRVRDSFTEDMTCELKEKDE